MSDSNPITCVNCQMCLAVDLPSHSNGVSFLSVTKSETPLERLDSLQGRPENLFSVISNSNSALEMPMCEDCAEGLLHGMDQQLKELESECTLYRKFLDSLKNGNSYRNFDMDTAHSKLSSVKNEEELLKAELNMLREEERNLRSDLSKRTGKLEGAEKEERELCWRKFRDNHRCLLDLESEEQKVASQLFCGKNQLERLTDISVLNKTFHIWSQDNFGTINGFRLGRLSHIDEVKWSEINAAWGQACLLFTVLVKRLDDFALEVYEVVAMGNHSFIRVLSTNAELPLYGSGDFKSVKSSKFDEAMCAFIYCFCQLQSYMEHKGKFHLPYRMIHGSNDAVLEVTIEPSVKVKYSVKLHLNSEERWTSAMKHMLINLKWTISYVMSGKNVLGSREPSSP